MMDPQIELQQSMNCLKVKMNASKLLDKKIMAFQKRGIRE